MAEFEKDKVPMMSRNLSMPVTLNTMDAYERDTTLRGEIKTPFITMSGPLYVTHTTGNISGQNIVEPGSKAVESKTKKFPFSGMSEHDCQKNDASKNEHLMRSGPLVVCNDPKCSTCFREATPHRDLKAKGLFNNTKKLRRDIAEFWKDEVPMMSGTHPKLSNEPGDSKVQSLVPRPRSVSVSIPMISMDANERDTTLGGQRKTPFIQMSGPLYVTHTTGNIFGQNIVAPGSKEVESKTEKLPLCGMSEDDCQNNDAGKNEHLTRSGSVGMCNAPYCTTCPTGLKANPHRDLKAESLFNPKFHNAVDGDGKDCERRGFCFSIPNVPRVIHPHTKLVQQWNKFFAICCLVAIFVDPLFFFLLSVNKEAKCIDIDSTMKMVIVILRSMNDLVHFLNIILQFRLAYVAPESTVVGAGEFVDIPKKIALHYLQTYFVIDLFVVLPLPQIMILVVLPAHLGSSGENYARNLLRAAVLAQYIPRLYRFLPVLISPTGFIFESAWASFFINLFTFMLSGHVVGSWWYLFGLQRVNQCLRNACMTTYFGECSKFIGCGHGKTEGYESDPNWIQWKNNSHANACFTENGFEYGIYLKAVNLTTRRSVFTRYVYSSFWGFQIPAR